MVLSSPPEACKNLVLCVLLGIIFPVAKFYTPLKLANCMALSYYNPDYNSILFYKNRFVSP